jgi:hypothetical protein
MADIDVQSAPTPQGWRCQVTVCEGSGRTRHEVTLDQAYYERLTSGGVPPERLVLESFTFLLAREPKEAILRAFDVSAIGRYFPEYEQEMARRLAQ